MVHPNDAYSTRKNNNTSYNAFHYYRQFNPPAQTPPLRQRASTGQLNKFLYSWAPLHLLEYSILSCGYCIDYIILFYGIPARSVSQS